MENTNTHSLAVSPSITNVADCSDTPIPNGGSTSDTSITLSGTAEANSVVVIYDGPAFKGSASVVSAGTWAKSISDLAAETHRFTARTADGTLISDEWVITTGVVITPVTITGVSDSTGPVGEGGTTPDTSVTVNGTAAANELVEIFNDTASLSIVRAVGGAWTQRLSGLTPGSYRIKVLGLYANNPESAVWSFSITPASAPVISSVREPGGVEIAPGGTTFSKSVTLGGAAGVDLEVQIFDGASALGIDTAAGGSWSLSLTGLMTKVYSIKARGLYGANPESATRAFTVAVEPLQIDQSTMILDGPFCRNSYWVPTGQDAPGNTAAREATGGAPPYLYTVSNDICLHLGNGKIKGAGNGVSTVTVSDQHGSQASYPVRVSNIFGVMWWPIDPPTTYEEAVRHFVGQGLVSFEVVRGSVEIYYRTPLHAPQGYLPAWLPEVRGCSATQPPGLDTFGYFTCDSSLKNNYLAVFPYERPIRIDRNSGAFIDVCDDDYVDG